MPITFNSQGGFLNGTISSSGNNIFIKTSGSVGIVHLDGDKVLLQSQSSGNTITASLQIEDDNLVINENLRVKRNEFRFKSADRTKEVKIDVSDNGNIRFKDNNDKEIVKFREGGRIDVGQNDTANSQSLTNWQGAISASGFVKCKNTFLGHNYGFPDNFILAHSDRVQNEDFSEVAGRGFAFGQNPAGHTFINAGDGTNAGYESINFYQAGLPSSILGKNRNWQFGLPLVSSVQFQPPEKLTVEGNISASGTIFADRLEVTQITSSIVTSSILKTEGSNIFGDTISDTHTFNGNVNSTGTGSFDGGMIIPNNTRITFGTVDTFISVDNDNPEDLVISADDDIFISPDDDIFMDADDVRIRTTAGSGWCTFNGGVQGLKMGGSSAVPEQDLHIEGANTQILLEEDSDEFIRIGVSETEKNVIIGCHDDNFIQIGNYSSTTDTTAFVHTTIDHAGNITSSANISSSGVGTFNSLDIAGSIDVDGTANLDDTDIDGTMNVQGAATLQSRTIFEIDTFTDGDTTPDVRPSTIFKTANTGATTITGFDNGTEGQIIHVVLQDNNTDFTNGTNLILFRGLNYTSGQTNDILSFLCLDGTKWLMLNAQDNS